MDLKGTRMKAKTLEELDTNDYTHIDDNLPQEDGTYDCIFRCGSMSISYKKMPAKFRRGQFTRWDWDHVIMWKEQE